MFEYLKRKFQEFPTKKKPKFWNLVQCADVGIDSHDNVWLFSRSKHPITYWTNDGDFIGSWGNS